MPSSSFLAELIIMQRVFEVNCTVRSSTTNFGDPVEEPLAERLFSRISHMIIKCNENGALFYYYYIL